MNNVLRPNAKVSEKTYLILTIGWVVATLMTWWFVIHPASPLIPTPPEVIKAIPVQWHDGAVTQLFRSILLSLKAIIVASVLGLGLSYLSTIPFFRAPVRAIGSMRVLSLTGLSLIFILATPNGEILKLSILVFSIIVFLVNSMLQVIDDIPSEEFDHARTLGMSQWGILREVVIRGTLSNAFDTLRMNAAMAWMMLTMVESISRSGGGIGITLTELGKFQTPENLAAIFLIQFMIFVVGIGQDTAIRYLKAVVCPYTVESK